MAKISIPIAVKGKINLTLNSPHRTTSDFGQLQVSNFIPVIPNDSFDINVFSEARFAPMVVPTFMDCRLVTRAFWVPMSAIYMPFEYFYTDKQDATAFKTIPNFHNYDVVDLFMDDTNGLVRLVTADDSYDFACENNASNMRYCIFTEKGRLLKKLFECLGYRINWTRKDQTPMSLLPLLAFARVAYDYIYPSQYLDGLGLTKFFKVTSSADYNDCFNTSAHYVAFFKKLLTLLSLPYKQDYFTASWQNLNAPGTSYNNVSAQFEPDNVGQNRYVEANHNSNNGNNGSPSAVSNVVSNKTTISQWQLNLLSRLYDFVTRRNILGTRYADQIFGIFGIGSRKSDPDMSSFIGQCIQPINVVDVTAMSASDNQQLGELAGKAFIKGQGHLCKFESADEFGYIVCLTFIDPNIGYYQGRKRWTTCFGRFDFYTPEFDMQMRAVRNDELFADFTSDADWTAGQSYGGNPSNRFSLAPTFSEYKKGETFITGDFNVPTLRENLDAYYLARDIKTPSARNPLALNADFLFQKQHEFDKIFAQMYTLRVNISTSEVAGVQDVEVVMHNGLPIVLWMGIAVDDEDTIYWVLIKVGEKLVALNRTAANLAPFGIVVGDGLTAEWHKLSAASGNVMQWRLASQFFSLYDSSSSTTMTSSNYVFGQFEEVVSFGDTNVLDYLSFLSYYEDYIDHIYLGHFFQIKAQRGVLPISQEFMIEDGGRHVNVDMNGNRLV